MNEQLINLTGLLKKGKVSVHFLQVTHSKRSLNNTFIGVKSGKAAVVAVVKEKFRRRNNKMGEAKTSPNKASVTMRVPTGWKSPSEKNRNSCIS